MLTSIQRVVEILDFKYGTHEMPQSRVLEWLDTDDPDVLGALYEAATAGSRRVVPSLSMAQHGEIVGKLLKVSLESAGVTDYAYTAYQAADAFMGFLLVCYRERLEYPETNDVLRWGAEFLASLYKGGSEERRRCIIDGAVEHLFEVRGVEAFFEGWSRDRVLGVGYSEAKEWASHPEEHGYVVSGRFIPPPR